MLLLKQDASEQFLVTVPPSDTPTRFSFRSFIRKHRNGGTVHAVAFEMPRSVVVVREPVSGDLAKTDGARPSFDSGVDTNVRDLG